jgi:tubulin alpha
LNIFFFKTENEKYIPRTIFLDLDSSIIDEIRTGKYNKLYYPEQLTSGKEDCTNKCSMRYCTLGKNICL